MLYCKISPNLQIHGTKKFYRANQHKYFGKVIQVTRMEVNYHSLNLPFVRKFQEIKITIQLIFFSFLLVIRLLHSI